MWVAAADQEPGWLIEDEGYAGSPEPAHYPRQVCHPEARLRHDAPCSIAVGQIPCFCMPAYRVYPEAFF